MDGSCLDSFRFISGEKFDEKILQKPDVLDRIFLAVSRILYRMRRSRLYGRRQGNSGGSAEGRKRNDDYDSSRIHTFNSMA